MKIVLVAFELDGPITNYPSLVNALPAIGEILTYVSTTWVFKTKLSLNDIDELLIKHFEGTSNKFVIAETSLEHMSYYPADAVLAQRLMSRI